MDTNNSPNPKLDTFASIWLADHSSMREIERLQAELDDVRFELDGCHNTIYYLRAELRRLRERYHVAAEGDL